MFKRDLMEITDNTKIDDRYAIKLRQLNELKEMSDKDIFEALTRAFSYGYAMGGRAAKAKAHHAIDRRRARSEARENR